MSLEKEIKRISNLKNYKDLSKEELEQVAKRNLIIREFKNSPLFSYEGEDPKIKKKVDEEQSLAVHKFKNYLDNYKIEKTSDLDTLKSLVFTEILELRIQNDINRLSIEGKTIPSKTTDQLISIQDQKSDLKLKIGVDKEDIKDSELTNLEKLEKRFERHIEENRNEFTLNVPLICEKCNHEASYMFLLRKRVKDFDALKHPWFVGRWFFNLPIIKFVKQGILTKEQAAEILSNASENIDSQNAFSQEYCSDMIEYMIEHLAEITKQNK